MFLGTFTPTVDDRGRLAIPTKYRPALADGLVITRGFDPCLTLWDLDEWRGFSERVGELSLLQTDGRRLQRHIFAGATDAVPDRLGRILIPAYLREYASLELGAEVFVAGARNRVEVWSRENWENESSTNGREGQRIAQQLADLGLQL
jgi:MraZ protein